MRFQSELHDFTEDIGLFSCFFHQHAHHGFYFWVPVSLNMTFVGKVLNHSSIKPDTQLTVQLFSLSHADPALLFPELRDPLSQRQLRQAPAFPRGEAHQRRALHTDPFPPRQLGHSCRNERRRSVTVRLAANAEGWPRFAGRCHVTGRAPIHAFHIAGDFHSALVWQGQHLHPRQAPRGGLPDGGGDAASHGDVLCIDGDIAVHDVRTRPDTCATEKRKITQTDNNTTTFLMRPGQFYIFSLTEFTKQVL